MNLFSFSNDNADNAANNSIDNNSNSNALSVPEVRRYASSREWLNEISSRQQTNVTPEIRARIAERGRKQKVRARKKKRAKVYQRCQKLNRQAFYSGNRAVMNSAPQFREESAKSSRNQMKSIQSVFNHRGADYEEDDDAVFDKEEEELESLVTNLEVAQMETADNVEDENSMRQILNQLKKEPKESAEVAAKFGLYEDYLGTVEDSRKATYDFWGECKSDFEAVNNSEHVIKTIENDLKKIDSGDNLGIIFHEHRWFVYDMTVKAEQNNEKLKTALHDLEIKLDLLDKEDECPFCLEAGKDSVTLGCCHKACTECWKHWQELKGANAFCPLCRQEDFLENMVEAEN
jgi:hypothetical protein